MGMQKYSIEEAKKLVPNQLVRFLCLRRILFVVVPIQEELNKVILENLENLSVIYHF